MSEQDTGRGQAVVIGAGIVGIATGLYLQRDGWQVTVIDPQEPGEGTSKGNAGLFAIGHVAPNANPSVLATIPGKLIRGSPSLSIRWRYLPQLLPWLIRFVGACNEAQLKAGTRALSSLIAGAMDAYEPLFQSAGASDLIQRKGILNVYRTAKSFEAERSAIELKREHGIRMEMLDGNGIIDLVPALAPIHTHGVFYPDYAHTVDPFVLTQTLARRLAVAGATFVKAEATGFSFDDNRVSAVRSADRAVEADMVVVAAGAHSKRLAAALGSRLPLDTERGYHITFANAGVDLEIPILSVDDYLAITPMESGLRSAGLVELGGLKLPPNPVLYAKILRHTMDLFPSLNIQNPSTWMGYRPAMPDTLPVIARTPKHSNAFLAFGHSHIGLTTAAATGRAIADLAADRQPQFDVEPFRADRF